MNLRRRGGVRRLGRGAGTWLTAARASTVAGWKFCSSADVRKPVCTVSTGGYSKVNRRPAPRPPRTPRCGRSGCGGLLAGHLHRMASCNRDGSVTAGKTCGYSGASPCFTPQRNQLSTTVPVSRMPMPPVRGRAPRNHHAQRWIDSAVALKPIVQRQNSAPRSNAVPRSTICSTSRSPPNRLIARTVAPCIANSSVDP